MQATACTSVVHVDSAVRWRRNGAGGLIRNSCLRVVVRLLVFWRFCNSQNCASRSQLTVLVRQRLPAPAFCPTRSTGGANILVPKSAGRAPLRTGICKFCEPPRGGASARPAEAGVYLKPRPFRTSFPYTYSRCRQLHIPVCRGAGKNSKFKMQNSQLWQACPAGSGLFLIGRPCARGRLALKARPPQPARASTRRINTAD